MKKVVLTLLICLTLVGTSMGFESVGSETVSAKQNILQVDPKQEKHEAFHENPAKTELNQSIDKSTPINSKDSLSPNLGQAEENRRVEPLQELTKVDDQASLSNINLNTSNFDSIKSTTFIVQSTTQSSMASLLIYLFT